VVIGGGPAGMMAAIRAAENSTDVTLIEKNPQVGKKLLLSGKGRCNLTNFCDLNSFLARFNHGDFLRDAFKKFFNQELMDFFEKRGLKLKVERQQRVFPVTDRSDSILEVLKEELAKKQVKILYKTGLKDIVIKDKEVRGVLTQVNQLIPAEKIILATGGVSYGFTGSTGEGLELARRLGHTIIALHPGLVPLETTKKYAGLAGLTLKNIRLNFSDGEKKISSDVGEMLFTHTGISGPLVFTFSRTIALWLANGRHVSVEIDLKPGLSAEQLHARLLREFKLNKKKGIKNILKSLIPLKLINIFIEISGIPVTKQAAHLTQAERNTLVSLLKLWRFDILRTRTIEEAMVTCGGVSLKEINPRTMESRLIRDLYFAGEMIDVDADTGGFNLQAAFSTGYLAGESACV